MDARVELLVLSFLSIVATIYSQGYGQDPTGGENCRVTGCGKNAYCNNDYNSRMTSCRCNVGFEVSLTNTSNCVDINECTHREVCENGICVNTVGGFRCNCFHGFLPAADRTFCLRADWAQQTDPWSDFWSFLGFGGRQSEPTFDYNNYWGPQNPNTIPAGYQKPYYNEYGNKPYSSQSNYVQQPNQYDTVSQYLPPDVPPVDFLDPFSTGPLGSPTNKQRSWNAQTNPQASRNAGTAMPYPHNPIQTQGQMPSGNMMSKNPVLPRGNVNSENPISFPNNPIQAQEPMNLGNMRLPEAGPTAKTGDAAAIKQWPVADPWNPQTNPLTPSQNIPINPPQNLPINPPQNIPLNPPQNMPFNPQQNMPFNPQQNLPMNPQQNLPMNPQQNLPMNPQQNLPMNPPQTFPVDQPIEPLVMPDKNTLNSNSITSGAAAVPQTSTFFKDPNTVSGQQDQHWLNFGQSKVNVDPATTNTWEAAMPIFPNEPASPGIASASPYTAQNEVGSKPTKFLQPPGDLTGHPLLLYLILQNLWQ